jgi:hypothetical protein
MIRQHNVLEGRKSHRMGWEWLETVAQDVRHGLRTLRKSSSFTAVANRAALPSNPLGGIIPEWS